MVKASDITTGALIIGGIWFYSKFKKPIDNVIDTVGDTTDKVIDVVDDTGSMAGDNYNYFFRGQDYPVPDEGTFKRDIYDSAKYSARLTTTLYDDTRNLLQLGKDRTLRFLGLKDNKSTLNRYRQSFNNSKFIGVSDVRSVQLQDNDSNVVGAYNNELLLSLRADTNRKVEENVNNKIVQIANKVRNSSSSSSSSSRSSSSSSKTKFSSSGSSSSSNNNSRKDIPIRKNVTTYKPSIAAERKKNPIIKLL